MRRFAAVVVLIAAVGLPTDLTVPERPRCAGGLCDVCPVVTAVVGAVGDRVSCVA